MPVKLFLPGERPVSWNQMCRFHYKARHARTERDKELVYYALFDALGEHIPPFEKRVDIEINVYFKPGKAHDSDNICVKGYVDGLVAFGIIKDDDMRYVRRVPCEPRKATKKHPVGVIITVKEVKE